MPPPTKNNSAIIKPGHRTILYGPGGIGKTTLAARAPGPVRFVDADESLPILNLPKVDLDQQVKAASWSDLRAELKSDAMNGTKSLVLDSGTILQAWATSYTLETVKHEKGHKCQSVEDYGFGKGHRHVYDTFMLMISDLDRLRRSGTNIILIAHDFVATVPNPQGEDWQRYEPDFYRAGQCSLVLRLKNWADHVLFLGYDVAVNKEGKAQGNGTRTIYTSELPHCMAKSRTTQEQIPVTADTDVWALVLK